MYKLHFENSVQEYESLQALKEDIMSNESNTFSKIAGFVFPGFKVWITDENDKTIAIINGDTIIPDLLENL